MICSSQTVSRDAVRAHYDDLDVFYRDVWGEHVHHGLWTKKGQTSEEAVCALSRHVAGLAGISAGDRVCDVGCGYGATARLLESEYGAELTGITVSERQYEVAKTRGGGAFVLGDWLENTFSDGAFDAVIAVESTEHIEDKARFFTEAARVLRPGGRAVVCAWLAAPGLHGFRKRLIARICDEGRMPGLGTASDYEEWAAKAGFVVESSEDVTRNVKRTWILCAIRFLRRVIRDPRYLRFLVSRGQPNRIFALTLFRILAAFETRALRYGILTVVREGRAFGRAQPGGLL